MSEVLTAATSTTVECPAEELQESLCRVQQLAAEVRQGHGEKFDDLERAVSTITESSWYTADDLPPEFMALQREVSRWGAAYYHLYLADQRFDELEKMQEGDDHWRFEDLWNHYTALMPLQPFFTPDMRVRYERLCAAVPQWKEIHDHLYYGGEAMAIIQDRFSPPDIRKLYTQVLALEKSSLQHAAYPLQRQRISALMQFWFDNIRQVFCHGTPLPDRTTPYQPSPQEVVEFSLP
jgi:hypothetical protein